ncbi:MAG: radical SAM protein [Clostridiales bacterium]
MNGKILNKFIKYNSLLPNSEYMYYPDEFIKMIHKDYLDIGIVQLKNPLYATWDIVDECNLKCVFCSTNAKSINYDFISKKNVFRIVDFIINSGIIYVSIRGGEPSLCKELGEVICRLTNSNVFVEIVTNGKNIDNKFFDEIINVPKHLIRIKISLDSYRQQVNDELRGKYSYNNVINAMKASKKNKYKFRIQMVVTKINYKDIFETYLLSEREGANSFGCVLLLPIGRGIKNNLIITINETILDQLIEIINLKLDTKLEKIGFGTTAFKFYKELLKNIKIGDTESIINEHIKCNGAKTRIYIDSKGDLYPCELLKYDEFYMGNVKNGIDNAWNSSVAKNFCKVNRFTKVGCKDCLLKSCNTGCFAFGYEQKLKIGKESPYCGLIY